MGRRWILTLAAVPLFGAVAADAPGESPGMHRRLPLLTIAQLGSVSWSCDGGSGGHTVWFRSNPATADDSLAIEAGASRKTVHLRPGAATFLRAGRARKVRIAIVQGTEARTLRASVILSFPGRSIGSSCYPYFPPVVALALHY